MDYSDDICMWEFTQEQMLRLRCTLTSWRPDLFRVLGSCENSSLAAELDDDTTLCEGDSVVLNSSVTGGVSPFSYSWTPTTGLSDATSATPTATPSSSITYTLTVTDNQDCEVQDSIAIRVIPSDNGYQPIWSLAASYDPDYDIDLDGAISILDFLGIWSVCN